jgi:hypothetical protein
MQLVIDGEIITDEAFATHRELVDRYREHEASQGRVPPSFAWEGLLVALGVFLAEYLGEKALDWLVRNWRGKSKEALDPGTMLVRHARAGGTVRIILETPAEAELIQQLRKQLPGVQVVMAEESGADVGP